MNLVDKSFWEEWAGESLDSSGYKLPFHDLLVQHLPQGSDLDFLEIGCAPGRNLVYFHKYFGYAPSGVDYIDNFEVIEQHIRNSGLKDYQLYHADLFEFKPNRKYDVVGNFGFIEHFTKWRDVLQAINALVKPEGYVVTSVPHFRRGQYILRRFLTPEVFDRHNLEVMDVGRLKSFYVKEGFQVLYAGYFQTFGFWGTEPASIAKKTIFKFMMKVVRFFEVYQINWPNRFFSPHIVIVARKPAQQA